jgi:putative acetyltransferase
MNINIAIQPIQPDNDSKIASFIRTVLEEFGANRPGTVYTDPTTDHLSLLFQQPGSGYYIAWEDTTIIGGAGFFPTAGLPAATCELVKMYLLPSARGKGIGRKLLQFAKAAAVQQGYRHMYIETMPELEQAIHLYEKAGFRRLNQPLGNNGHFGCDIWMLKDL